MTRVALCIDPLPFTQSTTDPVVADAGSVAVPKMAAAGALRCAVVESAVAVVVVESARPAASEEEVCAAAPAVAAADCSEVDSSSREDCSAVAA